MPSPKKPCQKSLSPSFVRPFFALFFLIQMPLSAANYQDSYAVKIRSLEQQVHSLQTQKKTLEEQLQSLERDLESKLSVAIEENRSLNQRLQQLEKRVSTSEGVVANDLATLKSCLESTIQELNLALIQESEKNHKNEQLLAKVQEQLLKNSSALEYLIQALDSDTPAPSVSSHSSSRYRVQEGDSLYKIARRFHVDLKALKEANHLQEDRLKIGQELIIPSTTP